MRLIRYTDPAEFACAVLSFLVAAEAENNLMLRFVGSPREGSGRTDAYLATVGRRSVGRRTSEPDDSRFREEVLLSVHRPGEPD